MPLFNWPHADLHSLNLDWIIKKLKTVEESEASAVSAAASAENSKTSAATSAETAEAAAAIAVEKADLITDSIAENVTAWLDEHITPTTPAVDNTLTVSGAAGDAAVAGDQITKTRITSLVAAVPKLTFIRGAINANVITASQNRCYTNLAVWHWLDSIELESADFEYRVGTVKTPFFRSGNEVTWRNSWQSTPYTAPKHHDGLYFTILARKVDGTNFTDDDIAALNSAIRYRSGSQLFSFRGTIGGTHSITDLKTCIMPGWYTFPGSERQTITDLPAGFSATGGTMYVNPVSFGSDTATSYIMQLLYDAAGNSFFRILQKNGGSNPVVFVDWKSSYSAPLEGMKLSVLGDSISAFAGEIPAGYQAYYTGSNAGVTNANQMWYNVLCRETGMQKLVIDAISGSGVTQLEDASHSSLTPMSAASRCENLGTESADPDIVIIAGGVNDFTYAQSAQGLPGSWDDTQAPVSGRSFSDQYAIMIKQVMNKYPMARIVCLSTWFTMRGGKTGYTNFHNVNGIRHTQYEYNQAIEDVCRKMHVPYIDMSNIGINYNNMYPTYAVDSSTEPTHPNAAGHALMARVLKAKLESIIRK